MNIKQTIVKSPYLPIPKKPMHLILELNKLLIIKQWKKLNPLSDKTTDELIWPIIALELSGEDLYYSATGIIRWIIKLEIGTYIINDAAISKIQFSAD